MPSYFPPKKNTAFIFYAALVSQANTKVNQSNPTIAAGDFKVSIDGGALANLATIPAVTPASSVMVKFSLSTSEMNGDNITIVCIDAAGSEWCDAVFNIQTAARQIDDLAYPATSGRSMVVDASGLVDANMVKVGPSGSGTAQTARDVGASVLLSTGTGTGQLDFTSGVVKANLAQILGTAITETSGQIAAAFKKFFDKASPTGTINSIPDAVAGATGGLFIAGTNAATTVTTSLTTTFTGNLTGNVGGNVTGSVGSLGAQAKLDVNAEADTAASDYGALKPTTAGRTLDVTVTGEAGIDWANIGAPTTTVSLSGTTVKTATDVETDTQDIQARLPAALTGAGNIKADTLAVNGSTASATGLEKYFGMVITGTAQSGSTSSEIVLAAGSSSLNNFYNGWAIVITGGTGVGQYNIIVDYDGTLKTAAVLPSWIVTPDNTTTYALIPLSYANTIGWSGGLVTVPTGGRIPVNVTTMATGVITAGVIATDAIGAAELAADAVAEIADGVWDEIASGHVTAGSYGQALNLVRAGTAQAGSGTTITLDASASAVDDFYKNDLIFITGGTGVGQARMITGYVGTTKVATVDTWATNPGSSSVFVILPGGVPTSSSGATAIAVWDYLTSSISTSGSIGKLLTDDIDAAVSSRLAPTTGGRTLDVTATGEAGIDWNNIGTPTSTVNLSGTTVKTSTDVETRATDIQSRLPAALTGAGNIKSDALAINGNTVSAASLDALFNGLVHGTIVSASAGGAVLDSAAVATSNLYDGQIILLTGGTGAGQARVINNYLSSRALIVLINWKTTPDATTTYVLLPGSVNVELWRLGLPNGLNGSRVDADVGNIQNSKIGAGTFSAGAITATAIASNAITAAKIATDAIGAAQLASDAVAEIQSGLATSSALTTAQTDLDDIQTRLPAALTGAGNMKADALALSGDTTAADNAESFFDGTGYAGTNNVIPTVTTVNGLAANTITATSIASDAITAAKVASDVSAEIADGVWDEAASGHTTAGTYGQALNIIRADTATAGTGTTITLDVSASAVDDFYKNDLIFITGGTGIGQARVITGYVGLVKTATVDTWATNPDNTSVFVILPAGVSSSSGGGASAADVWTYGTRELTSGANLNDLSESDIRNAVGLATANLDAQFAGISGGGALDNGTAQSGTSTSITLRSGANANNEFYKYALIWIVSGTGASQMRFITEYDGTSKTATVDAAWVTTPDNTSVYQIMNTARLSDLMRTNNIFLN